MKIISILILGAVFCSSGQAKVLVVSDIDDTIKISHVVSKTDAMLYAFETDNVFLGMNHLYRFFQNKWGNEAEIFYLTNAPEWLMEDFHLEFLQRNHFPQGQLSLSEFMENPMDHKLSQIRAKLHTGLYQTVILIGDNGEQDPFIYAQIQKEFPRLQIKTFIHQLYSVNAEDEDYVGVGLQQNQVGYVTPVEILLELSAAKILALQDVVVTVAGLSKQVRQAKLNQDEGEIMFPSWQDCRDFHWKWKSEQEEVRLLKAYVLNRCSQNPEENELWRLSKIARRK